jgi:hypothetical protein
MIYYALVFLIVVLVQILLVWQGLPTWPPRLHGCYFS